MSRNFMPGKVIVKSQHADLFWRHSRTLSRKDGERGDNPASDAEKGSSRNTGNFCQTSDLPPSQRPGYLTRIWRIETD